MIGEGEIPHAYQRVGNEFLIGRHFDDLRGSTFSYLRQPAAPTVLT
ncbi:hypothetical protein [Pseudonocardia sp. NPDC049154]